MELESGQNTHMNLTTAVNDWHTKYGKRAPEYTYEKVPCMVNPANGKSICTATLFDGRVWRAEGPTNKVAKEAVAAVVFPSLASMVPEQPPAAGESPLPLLSAESLLQHESALREAGTHTEAGVRSALCRGGAFVCSNPNCNAHCTSDKAVCTTCGTERGSVDFKANRASAGAELPPPH
jgi:hypothetical protein